MSEMDYERRDAMLGVAFGTERPAPSEPRTEAGRALLERIVPVHGDHPRDSYRYDGCPGCVPTDWRVVPDDILAIEEQARAKALDGVRRAVDGLPWYSDTLLTNGTTAMWTDRAAVLAAIEASRD